MTASIYSNVVMQFDLFRLDEYLKKLSVEGRLFFSLSVSLLMSYVCPINYFIFIFEGNERLPLVFGGEIPSTFDDPESVKLGYRDLIAKILIGGGHYLVGFCYKL
jgi:hypothetical protein